MSQMQDEARERKMSLAEWVRTTLREALRSRPSGTAEKKLAAVRAAAQNDFPTADIDQMLREIAASAASRV